MVMVSLQWKNAWLTTLAKACNLKEAFPSGGLFINQECLNVQFHTKIVTWQEAQLAVFHDK